MNLTTKEVIPGQPKRLRLDDDTTRFLDHINRQIITHDANSKVTRAQDMAGRPSSHVATALKIPAETQPWLIKEVPIKLEPLNCIANKEQGTPIITKQEPNEERASVYYFGHGSLEPVRVKHESTVGIDNCKEKNKTVIVRQERTEQQPDSFLEDRKHVDLTTMPDESVNERRLEVKRQVLMPEHAQVVHACEESITHSK